MFPDEDDDEIISKQNDEWEQELEDIENEQKPVQEYTTEDGETIHSLKLKLRQIERVK